MPITTNFKYPYDKDKRVLVDDVQSNLEEIAAAFNSVADSSAFSALQGDVTQNSGDITQLDTRVDDIDKRLQGQLPGGSSIVTGYKFYFSDAGTPGTVTGNTMEFNLANLENADTANGSDDQLTWGDEKLLTVKLRFGAKGDANTFNVIFDINTGDAEKTVIFSSQGDTLTAKLSTAGMLTLEHKTGQQFPFNADVTVNELKEEIVSTTSELAKATDVDTKFQAVNNDIAANTAEIAAIDGKINTAIQNIPTVDLSNYDNKAEVTNKITTALSGYADTNYVDNKLGDYMPSTVINNKFLEQAAIEGLIGKTKFDSATNAVTFQGDLILGNGEMVATQADLSGYADTELSNVQFQPGPMSITDEQFTVSTDGQQLSFTTSTPIANGETYTITLTGMAQDDFTTDLVAGTATPVKLGYGGVPDKYDYTFTLTDGQLDVGKTGWGNFFTQNGGANPGNILITQDGLLQANKLIGVKADGTLDFVDPSTIGGGSSAPAFDWATLPGNPQAGYIPMYVSGTAVRAVDINPVIDARIQNAGGGTQAPDLSAYYTSTQVDSRISAAVNAIPMPDLAAYSTTAQVNGKITTAIGAIALPDLSLYDTSAQVNTKVASRQGDLGVGNPDGTYLVKVASGVATLQSANLIEGTVETDSGTTKDIWWIERS